jgi:uncharacterized protein
MSLSMYQASIPPLLRMLGNFKAILEKGAAYEAAKKLDPSVLPNCRLYPDMLPLRAQVYIATDAAKGCPARLSGTDPVKFEDTEQTLAELIARVDKTIALLKAVKPEQVDGSEARAVTINTPRGPLHFQGQQYLQHFVLPNFYFHVTTAYNILRHNGVELGKLDYLGQT